MASAIELSSRLSWVVFLLQVEWHCNVTSAWNSTNFMVVEIKDIIENDHLSFWFFLLAAKAGFLSGFSGIESVPGPQLPQIDFLNRLNGLILSNFLLILWFCALSSSFMRHNGLSLCRRKPEEVRWSWWKIQVIPLAQAAVRAVKAEQRNVIQH